MWKDFVESLLYLHDEYDYTQDVREEKQLKKKHILQKTQNNFREYLIYNFHKGKKKRNH